MVMQLDYLRYWDIHPVMGVPRQIVVLFAYYLLLCLGRYIFMENSFSITNIPYSYVYEIDYARTLSLDYRIPFSMRKTTIERMVRVNKITHERLCYYYQLNV